MSNVPSPVPAPWVPGFPGTTSERVKGFTVQAEFTGSFGEVRITVGNGGRVARVRPTAVSDFSATLEMTVALFRPSEDMEVGRWCLGVFTSASRYRIRPRIGVRGDEGAGAGRRRSGCGETKERVRRDDEEGCAMTFFRPRSI